MTDNLLFTLDACPPEWWWSLENPLPSQKSRRGKKTFKYSVYMANGQTIGSAMYCSVWVDDDDLTAAVQRAREELLAKIISRKAELEKLKAKKK